MQERSQSLQQPQYYRYQQDNFQPPSSEQLSQNSYPNENDEYSQEQTQNPNSQHLNRNYNSQNRQQFQSNYIDQNNQKQYQQQYDASDNNNLEHSPDFNNQYENGDEDEDNSQYQQEGNFQNQQQEPQNNCLRDNYDDNFNIYDQQNNQTNQLSTQDVKQNSKEPLNQQLFDQQLAVREKLNQANKDYSNDINDQRNYQINSSKQQQPSLTPTQNAYTQQSYIQQQFYPQANDQSQTSLIEQDQQNQDEREVDDEEIDEQAHFSKDERQSFQMRKPSSQSHYQQQQINTNHSYQNQLSPKSSQSSLPNQNQASHHLNKSNINNQQNSNSNTNLSQKSYQIQSHSQSSQFANNRTEQNNIQQNAQDEKQQKEFMNGQVSQTNDAIESTQQKNNQQEIQKDGVQEQKQTQKQQQLQQPKQNDDFLRKPFNQLNPLEKLKYSQYIFKQNWRGIQTEFTGRPGTSTLCNKKRSFTDPPQMLEEDKRNDALYKIIEILSKIEQDIPIFQQIQNQVAGDLRQNKSAYNFYQNKKQQQINNYVAEQQDISRYLDQNQMLHSFKTFNTIKMHQLLNDLPPTQTFGHAAHIDNSELLYKILRGDTKLVRSMLEANGMNYTESHEWNILWSSSSCKAYLYEGMNEHQRINHFPSSYEVTRKDRLCFNMVKMQEKFGRQNYDIVPDTYILPQEYKEFVQHFNLLAQKEPKKNIWIVKPANLSRGRGIHLIDSLNDVYVDDVSVVSRYITNPLLINGHKFDLRIYVLVTSYEPLRVYVFKEGLARFASETYSSKIDKDNKFMHLTNYSINKKNDNFVYNQNDEQDDVGFKWSLSAFCSHLEQVGIDMNLMWSRIYDLIIKAILSGEHYVNASTKKYNLHRNNCFEVFGYDVILDSELKPWLLEVNLSPSLACESPLDLTIKSTLLADTFNMIGIKKYDRRKESLSKIKNRANTGSTKPMSANLTNSAAFQAAQQSLNEIFHSSQSHFVTPQVSQLIERLIQEEASLGGQEEIMNQACLLKNREIVWETLSEYKRKGNFVRIYPSRQSNMYDQFFQATRPLNKLLHKVLFSDRLLKHQGYSLTTMQVSSPKFGHQDLDLVSQSSSASVATANKTAISTTTAGTAIGVDNKQRKSVYTTNNLINGGGISKSNVGQDSYSSVSNQSKNLAQSNGTTPRSGTLGRTTINNQRQQANVSSQLQYQQYQPVKTTVNNYMTQSMNGGIQPNNDNSNISQQSSRVIKASKSPQNMKYSAGVGHNRSNISNNGQQHVKIYSPDSSIHSQRQPVTSKNGSQINASISTTTTPLQQKENNQQQQQAPSQSSVSQSQASVQPQEKIIITGDDILIEYVSRVVYIFKQAVNQKDNQGKSIIVNDAVEEATRRFVTHQVWHVKEQYEQQSDNPYWMQMELRMNEMLDRRRRLIKYMLKKDGKIPSNTQTTSPEFEVLYKEAIDKKNSVVQRFSSQQLEDLLKTSTKNVAQEVVSCMIPIAEGMKGLLLEAEKIYPLIAKQRKDQIRQARQQEKNENINIQEKQSNPPQIIGQTTNSQTNTLNKQGALAKNDLTKSYGYNPMNRAVSPHRSGQRLNLTSNSSSVNASIKRAQSRQNERYNGTGTLNNLHDTSNISAKRTTLNNDKGRNDQNNAASSLSQSQTLQANSSQYQQQPKSAKNAHLLQNNLNSNTANGNTNTSGFSEIGNKAAFNKVYNNNNSQYNQKNAVSSSSSFSNQQPVLSNRDISSGATQRSRYLK